MSPRWLLVPAIAFAPVLASALAAAAVPSAKVAVMILPGSPRDRALADNVTEVVIARLAALGAAEIVGTAEVRRRVGLTADGAAQACLDQPTCVDRIAVSLGMKWIVTGSVTVRGTEQFLFSLALRDVERGRIDRRVLSTAEGPIAGLVRRVQSATDDLLRPKPPEGRLEIDVSGLKAEASLDQRYVGVPPLTLEGLTPGRHVLQLEAANHFPWSSQVEIAPDRTTVLKLAPGALRSRLRWPRYAVAGTAAGAVLSLAGATVLGSIALFSPLTGDRAEAQRQFDDRRTLGAVADGLLVGSAVLAGASALLAIAYHKHLFQ